MNTLFTATETPVVASAADSSPVEVGLRFRADVDGEVSGIRFWKGVGNTVPHVGTLWDAVGRSLAHANWTNETATGWQWATFPPVSVKAGKDYVVSVYMPKGCYAYDHDYFGTPHVNGHLTGVMGVYLYKTGGGFPTQSYRNTNYWVDLAFVPAAVVPPPPLPPVGNVKYVAPNGADDSGDGSAAKPWRTLSRAARELHPGDTIIARAGNYTGFNIPWSGTAANRITFRGEPGAVIDAPVNFGGGTYGINASGMSYLTIEGFTFKPQAGQSEWYSAIRLGGTGTDGQWCSGNIIRNNTVQMRETSAAVADKYGLYSSWQDGVLVENNKVSGGYNTGIYTTENSRNYIVRGNEVFNCGGNGIHNNAGPKNPGVIKNALIDGNIIHNVGFWIGGQAISCDGVQNSRIQNNLLYDIHAKGISLYAVNAQVFSVNNVVVNNTIVCVSVGAPLRINSGSNGNVILNNIFAAANGAAGWVDAEESGLSGSRIDYNVTYGVAMVGGAKRTDWKTSYGFDTHSIASTPAAVFVGGGNYRLKPGSPAIDAGTPTNAPTKDIVNNTRPVGIKPDIGAYEYI